MSYQTSIHFDPTALLTIKKEVENSIQLVESAVSSLVEDQSLPFGIDDALAQFEQCARVLLLVDMPHLAKITDYCAQLMRKVMQNPTAIETNDVIALSEGTTMLKRYIEFSCLREVKVPQFLQDTLNRLELSLNLPLTPEGEAIMPFLQSASPSYKLPKAPVLEKSDYVHKLYKISLNHLLRQQETELDLQGIKLVGAYLSSAATETASATYWNLVYVALDQVEQLILSDARLRILIAIETQIQQFLQDPAAFKAELQDLANVLSLCISQDDETSQYIREQANIGDDLLSDTQLQVFSKHLYGPDFQTMHSVSKLITEEMVQIRNDIEYNYQNMSEDKALELKTQLINLAHVFKVLNLQEAYVELKQQADLLTQQNMTQNENYAQQLMNSILSAMNSIGILERNYTSSRLQLRVNNMGISLDRLDEAHAVLLDESRALVDLSSQSLIQSISEPETTNLELLPSQLKEISGALLFLGQKEGQQALLLSANFLQQLHESEQKPNEQQIKIILDVLASADMMIDNMQNRQPVLKSMFDIALNSSQKLQTAAVA